ncbi:MAG TPA: hypothetical protein VFH06_00970 [Candidatus Saccharimonadales bacterium]|nr:hypothetical protein [Candidatus Saccharimonadales bacterium]
MDIQPTNQQPISDDQELAKVLAGVTQQADEAATTPAPDPVPATEPQEADQEVAETPAPAVAPEPAAVSSAPAVSPLPAATGLDSIKQDALSELRPLVDKLNVAPEEKFDTYLLLIRSTDDQSLIGPAHEAARAITDEARRAQALLDIIKEIDYLAGPQQSAA